MLLRLFPKKEEEEELVKNLSCTTPHQNKTASKIAQVFSKRAQLLRQITHLAWPSLKRTRSAI
jgi:hypothetical protein